MHVGMLQRALLQNCPSRERETISLGLDQEDGETFIKQKRKLTVRAGRDGISIWNG
jgi:hypothetical protein